MQTRMSEKEILANFDTALDEGQIFAYYQPQVNHVTGCLVGAEALMRWEDPQRGIQYPADFIPVLERHDLIYRADMAIFDCVCRFLRRCLDEKLPVVPISVNMSRYDIVHHDYVSGIESIRQRYDVPTKFIRIELTESSAIGGMELVTGVIDALHAYGYVIELDDFGSGYSSLNVLKDLNVDIIKLDIQFMRQHSEERNSIIINSIVQMAKWLNTPVIAEGVETDAQAEYLKNIGCNYIQGYLYSRPVTEEQYRVKLRELRHETLRPVMDIIEHLDAGKFWDPESVETLIFSNFVGAAALFSYQDGYVDVLRVNEKYLMETGMNQSEVDVVKSDFWHNFDAENRRIYEETIRRAIESGEEEGCETWRTLQSKCCGEDTICIKSTMRVIGSAGRQHLVYTIVQNITAAKKDYGELFASEQKFRHAIEQANMYAWEFDLITKEVRPCFRCMRDLHLAPVMPNFPDCEIELGIIPPDYADMYRDWMNKLQLGDESLLETTLPLTVGRVPFHVRYTVERDANGRPIKAYGSATMVVKNQSAMVS